MKSNHIFALFGFLISLFLIITLSARSNLPARADAPAEVFFSEYVEGSSYNKALEIYNGTGSTIDLSAEKYDIQMFFNGNASAGLTILLTGTVASGDVYVVAHSSASTAILAQADQTNNASWYNGDDTVVLRKNGTIIDVIGQIGFDPGLEWGTGEASTAGNTLRRRSSICQGDSNGADVFSPELEWNGFAENSFDGLGTHTANCPTIIGSCGDPALLIHTIQGNGMSSPLTGAEAIVEGVVVGDFQDISSGLRGFFLQEEVYDTDADLSTSEGVFVRDYGFGVDVSPGQVVRVKGEVSEYYSQTELSNISAIKICPYTNSVTAITVNLPVTNLSDWERWEGMLVSFPQTLSATENYNLGRYGEVELSVYGRLYAPTQIVAPGSLAVQRQELNDRSRIQLDDGSNVQNPLPLPPYLGPDHTLRLGDTVTGLMGVLGYSYGKYEIHPTQPVSFTRVNQRLAPPAILEGSLKIVSMNLLNYFTTLDNGMPICGPSSNLDCRGANTVEEFTRQQTKILFALLSTEPDIAGLVEIENNATEAIENLVNGLNNLFGAGTYTYINTGTIGTDAIKVAIIYKPARVTPVGPFKILDSSGDPNFIDTKNRPSLAQTFETPAGSRFTVVVNHFKSKGSSCNDVNDPDTGDGQGNCNQTRTKAAAALVSWLETDPTGSQDDDFLLIGDFNAYAQEDPISTFKNAGYVNLVEMIEGSQAYSYTFEGQSGTLDYALASPSFAKQIGHVYDLHLNADEPGALDYNDYNQPGLYKPDIYRYADHDPIMVLISPWKVTQAGDELQIAYLQGDEYPQYAALHLNDSYFRMNYGPASGWGTSLVLMPAFWSEGSYYQGAPVTVNYRVIDNFFLELTVNGNNHGLQVSLTITLRPPALNALTARVEGRVLSTVPIDDDRPGEAFKPLFLSSMHISPSEWDTSAAFVSMANLSIPTQSWIIGPTPPVINTFFGLWGGTSAWKTNAPTIQVELGQPLQIAGWVTGSSDPNDDNVGLWAASDQILDFWSYTVTASNRLQPRVYLPVIRR